MSDDISEPEFWALPLTLDSPMPPAEFSRRMTECDALDTETGHAEADRLMCEALRRLGYEEGVRKFLAMRRWYS